MTTAKRTRPSRMRLLALALAASLVAAACGGDDGSDAAPAPPPEPAPAPAPEPEPAPPPEPAPAAFPETVDVNGDGQLTIGYVVAGDRADGGFYQGQVESVEAIAAERGYETIVVDKVNPGAARESFENLARQNVDLIIAGGSELRDGFIPVSEDPTFSDINFFLVAGFPPTSGAYATAAANENQAHFMGGVSFGLLLERTGGTVGCVVAGPELDFVKNMAASMRAGLSHVQDAYGMAAGSEIPVTFTGSFEDAALAQESATALFEQDCEVVYPYLGGALIAVVNTALESGVGVVSTSVDLCDADLFPVAMAITYNPALFLPSVISSFAAGELEEGTQLAVYGVGSDLGVGSRICDASADEQAILDEVRAALASGDIDVNAIIGTDISG